MHLMLFLRFFTLQNDFDNRRNTSDSAKGLFQMRTTAPWMPSCGFKVIGIRLQIKCQIAVLLSSFVMPNQEDSYITYAEETNRNGIYKLLFQAQFLRMWREKVKRVIIPKVSITYNPLQEFKIHLIQCFLKAIM